MKRIFDLALAFTILFPFIVPMLLIAISVKASSQGPVLYWSERIGKGNKYFNMPKFRTMLIDTPTLATHLIGNPNSYLTPIGSFLRLSSLDELPQLFSIIKGDMSFVGLDQHYLTKAISLPCVLKTVLVIYRQESLVGPK